MSARAASKLYSPAMLALAAQLAEYPLTDDLPLRAERRSRTCGSVIIIGLDQDDDGLISHVGVRVSACAIGQASASLLAQAIRGDHPGHVQLITDGIVAWLAGEGGLPQWPGLDALAPARDHPGRHGALLLPWTAACMALSSGAARG